MTGRRRKGALGPEDKRLWVEVTKTVRPLRPAPVEPVETEPPAPPIVAVPPPPPLAPPPARRPVAPPGKIEKTLQRKIRRGAEPISERLDLHGLTEVEAHARLLSVLRAARRRGTRVLLVITGKGAAEGGVLRRAVPRWLALAECHELVVGFETAHARHGGAGALYVHIRRARAKGRP